PSRPLDKPMTQLPQTSPDDAQHQAIREQNLRAAAENTANESRYADPGDAAARFPFNGRWTRRDWAHASLFATLGALVIGLVPGFSNAMRIDGHAPELTTLSLPCHPCPRRWRVRRRSSSGPGTW